MKLDVLFSPFVISKRGDVYVSRSLDSFDGLIDTLIGRPVLLEHPCDLDNGEKALLSSNTDYMILGNIESYHIVNNSVRVILNVLDPKFKDFYNSLNDEEKINLEISPAVTSEFINPVEIDGNLIYQEKIKNIDHLSILITSEGYFTKYLEVEQTPVKDHIEENDINDNSDNIDSNEENKIDNIDSQLERYVNDDSIIQHNINNINSNGDFMKNNNNEVEEVKIDSMEEEHVLDSEEEVKEDKMVASEEEVKIDSEEDKKEEQVVDSEEEPKEENKIDSEEEEVKEKVEELVKHEESEAEKFEELAKDHEELDSDEITEDFETEQDKEREVLVKIAGNLCDSIEGFRQPYFGSKRVKPGVYAKKLLNLNKNFIDSKYHSVIDSIDDSSVRFAKDILDSLVKEKKKNSNLIQREYVQVSHNRFVKQFW